MNNQKGFTLIEMIVVVTVMSIILLLAVPSVNAYSENLNRVESSKHEQRILKCIKQYYAIEGKYPENIYELQRYGANLNEEKYEYKYRSKDGELVVENKYDYLNTGKKHVYIITYIIKDFF